jgi:probable addiction module antidote protein
MKNTKKIKIKDLSKFDVVDYLRTDADIAGYLTAVLEDGDPVLFDVAIGGIAKRVKLLRMTPYTSTI